jgi:integrase
MTDVAALLAYLQQNDPELFCAVSIAAVIGARRSEIIGLRWDDFDPANDALRLTHGLIAVPKQGRVETSTKTGETIAGGISIGADLSGALVRMKTRRLEEGVSPKKIGKTYIFAADKEGIRSWHPDTISTRLRKACEAAGEDRARITLKDLRTFVASELVQQPFGLQIARDVLRHTNVKTTLRHYLAAEKKRNREATGKLAGSLGIATELVLAFQAANEDQE